MPPKLNKITNNFHCIHSLIIGDFFFFFCGQRFEQAQSSDFAIIDNCLQLVEFERLSQNTNVVL